MAYEDNEHKLFSSFEKHEEFARAQLEFLLMDLTMEPSKDQEVEDQNLYQKLVNILDEYQEQSYLLDPYLEELVIPVVERLRFHAKQFLSDHSRRGSNFRIWRLSMLLYNYTKCLRFFPHEIADLWIVLGYLDAEDSCAQDSSQWALRYVLLLWLSLVCMLPFDLSQFDESEDGHTARLIEHTSRRFLSNAGLEREGAAIALSHFYMRQDAVKQFAEFFEWGKEIASESSSLFTAIGILHVLCEVLRSGPLELVQSKLPDFMALVNAADSRETFANNALVRKLKTKLISRIGLRLLPARVAAGRFLTGNDNSPQSQNNVEQEEDVDVPEEVEMVLEQLFAALQDKDTLVRWSAAKGVARIAERLPTDLSDQVLETVLGHFAIHSVTAASLYDVPATAEATWHGACLACAEMTRRGVVSSKRLEELVGWLSKALYFDLRKGAHSVGSNVRDASAYVLWALARSQEIPSLSPLASDLARHLVTVSLYDREVQIRRAASAGFQEFVGRTNLFPHGIDVLRKTDFYAVGIRRNSFLTAAPQVAEHVEYRPYLLDHLLNVALRHWDISMRRVGAQSLHRICLVDIKTLGPEAVQRCVKLLGAIDNSDIHGGLLGLIELALAYEEILNGEILEAKKREIWQYLSHIPESTLLGPRNEIVTAAACDLMTRTITLPEIKLGPNSAVSNWNKIVEYGLKHRDLTVQESAAATIEYCRSLVASYVPTALRHPVGTAYRILVLTVEDVSSIFDALFDGLNDYSVDERGDVGSWIRIACVNALGNIAELLVVNARQIADFESYLPSSRYHECIRGILKQGVERLDNVRQESGRTFLKLLLLSPPDVQNSDSWIVHRSDLLRGLFVTDEEIGWNDANWLFPKAVQILDVETYRKPVLLGLIASVGSLTDSTHRPVSASLVSYVRSLPLRARELHKYNLLRIASDLLNHAKANSTVNSVVIPVFQVFNLLLDGDAFRLLGDDDEGNHLLRQLFSMVSRYPDRIKNVKRLYQSMKVVVYLLSFEGLYKSCVEALPSFLSHQYPSVRSETAEFLYISLQSMDFHRDIEEAENLLLETEW
ncbi:tubulin folding cofactor D C terminal-domain-containing protein [Lentinula aciculospora]|uniref:Tubulin folding cofactor D C terminal-domain-containing protein n=1 Tax=Lentinula aciculospora TaxID=153920 RepID=A0A9W9AGF8_9AGAR|nr:tubulin folding cofactor D C terminal-domain-containing protein [Lentinula aciculospora]